MLIVKVLEGIVRIIRRQPFSGSRQAIDSGLLGAMGCCGSSRRNNRRKQGAHRQRRKPRPGSNYSSSTARSQTVNGTTITSTEGYMKPGHTPARYKEDSDEEPGFIMSSWKPDLSSTATGPFTGSAAQKRSGESGRSRPSKVSHGPSTNSSKPGTPDQANAPTSGFTRLGGGRAHHETPWAIVQGKKALQPGRNASVPAPLSLSPSAVGQTGSLPTSIPHVEPLASISTPQQSPTPAPPPASGKKGARPSFPFHGRTRSQTAIVEDASTLAVGSSSGRATSPKPSSRPPSSGKSRPSSSGKGRPGSSGTGKPSRPPSSGQVPRPSSSGQVPRPPSSGQVPRPPSSGHAPQPPAQYIEVPSVHATQAMDLGAPVPATAGPSNPGRSRGWFGILGGKEGDSSDDGEDHGDDEERSNKRGGLWTFGRKRRKSESDMSPIPSPGVATENRSFVVLRGNNRPSYDALMQAAVVDRHGSIVESRSLGAAAGRAVAQESPTVLIPMTPLSPDEDGMHVHANSPPSSYNPPYQARRMSNPTL
jgi:hypothetical protein